MNSKAGQKAEEAYTHAQDVLCEAFEQGRIGFLKGENFAELHGKPLDYSNLIEYQCQHGLNYKNIFMDAFQRGLQGKRFAEAA